MLTKLYCAQCGDYLGNARVDISADQPSNSEMNNSDFRRNQGHLIRHSEINMDTFAAVRCPQWRMGARDWVLCITVLVPLRVWGHNQHVQLADLLCNKCIFNFSAARFVGSLCDNPIQSTEPGVIKRDLFTRALWLLFHSNEVFEITCKVKVPKATCVSFIKESEFKRCLFTSLPVWSHLPSPWLDVFTVQLAPPAFENTRYCDVTPHTFSFLNLHLTSSWPGFEGG